MQWSKFSLLLVLLLSSSVFAQKKFTSVQCLNSDFETKVKNEGKFFGLIKNDLLIKKNKCLIEVTFKGILETVWKVDICREPIHMKVKSKGNQSVYKRVKKCDSDNKTDYCYFRDELILNLQDQGLIFAKGLKEQLSDAHGQVYCSYLLLKKYLDEGHLFSQFDKEINLYKEEANCEIPKESEKTNASHQMTAPIDGGLRDEIESKSSNSDDAAPSTNASETKGEVDQKKPRF